MIILLLEVGEQFRLRHMTVNVLFVILGCLNADTKLPGKNVLTGSICIIYKQSYLVLVKSDILCNEEMKI